MYYTAGQTDMQKMDQYTMEKLGLPGVVLMENAGAKVVEEILALPFVNKPRVVVLAGSGNNGGDGFVIARRLVDAGMDALLCLLVNPERLKGDAKIHFDVCRNRRVPIFYLFEKSLTDLRCELEQCDIVVDAILGTGVSGAVREPVKQVIAMVNELGKNKLVIAVDIPSGLSSDTGRVIGTAIKADKTITFVFPKKGFFLQDGPLYIGEWKAVDISVPRSLVAELGLDLPKVITEPLVRKSVPSRPRYGHKGTFGHALVLGGSRSYVGAPIFTAKAALHSGSGLVTLAIPESVYPYAAAQCTEALMLPLADMDGHFAEEALQQLIPRLSQFKSIAVGPGMSRFAGGEEWMLRLFSSLSGQPVVVDADGLYLLKDKLEFVQQYQGDVIFTPHPGEMAGMLGESVREVEEDRIGLARAFAKEYNVHLLLKGHRTVIASPSGDTYINPHGHDALGKGGSGDVLTGLIASFLAQGASPINALISASYLHARAGENMAKVLSRYGVMPLDVIGGVRELLKEFE